MEKKQTAVEWLEKEIENISIQVFDGFLTFIEFMEEREKLCRQAKEMEKQQIKGSWLSAWKDSMLEPLEDKYYEPEAEQYYNEEYGSNNEQQ